MSAKQFESVMRQLLSEDELKDMYLTTGRLVGILRKFHSLNEREIKRMESWIEDSDDPNDRRNIQKDIKKLSNAFPSQFYIQLLRWHKKIRIS